MNSSRANQNGSKRNSQSIGKNSLKTSHSYSYSKNNDDSNKTRRNDHHHYQQQNHHHSNRRHNSNEAFFGSDSNDNDEFDFEQNLALFDKNAFYEEVEGHSRPSDDNEENSSAFDTMMKHISLNPVSCNQQLYNTTTHRQQEVEKAPTQPAQAVIYHPISLASLFSSSNLAQKGEETKITSPVSNSNTTPIDLVAMLAKTTPLSATLVNGGQAKNGNYRFDEMVLDTGEPIDMQQITVPPTTVKKRYVTDDGFIVPCVDYNLRQMIFEQSYKQGRVDYF